MYELEKMSLDERNDVSVHLKVNTKIYKKINRPNDMNCIHDNKVNKKAECNLLHDIPNSSKHTKYINNYYSNILHGFMNTQKGSANFTDFII